MNVPTLPGQQVQVQGAPAAFGQVAPVGNAPVLGAVAQATQQFGQQAGDKAAQLQAQQRQTELLQASADARKASDERYVAFRGLSGDLAQKGGALAVADYQKWAAEYESHLAPDVAPIFHAHAEEIGAGLARDIGDRVYTIHENMANAALTQSYQTQEQSAFGAAASGLITLRTVGSQPAQPESGLRADGTPKGTGFLGPHQRPDGSVSSELSIGVEIAGKETEIPTMVPGLTKGELDYLLNTEPDQIQTADPAMFKGIEDKAVAHAEKRIARGLSPFAKQGDGAGTQVQSIFDERALQERVNTVVSAGKVWLQAHPGADAIEAQTTKEAVARVYAAAIQGSLEAGPHQDYRVAQKLYDVHAGELGDQREKMQALTSNATIVGSADDAEKAAFFTQAKNDGSTTDRLTGMLKAVDAANPPAQVSNVDAWRDRVKAGVRQREGEFQRDEAVKRDGFHHDLDAEIMAGTYKDFAQVEQTAKYAALAKEPGLQRALASTWKQRESGDFTVTSRADKADAIDMLTNPDRAREAMTYNFAAHPQRFSHDDITEFESIQKQAFTQAQAGAEKSKTGLDTLLGIRNQKAKEFYPGKDSDQKVLDQRGAFLDLTDSIVKSYKRAHNGNEPDTDWFRKEVGLLHAEQVMRVPVKYEPMTPDPEIPVPPWGLQQQTMTGKTYEEVTGSLLDKVPADQLNQIISDLLASGVEAPTADMILARLADTQARTEAAGGH